MPAAANHPTVLPVGSFPSYFLMAVVSCGFGLFLPVLLRWYGAKLVWGGLMLMFSLVLLMTPAGRCFGKGVERWRKLRWTWG